MNDTILFGNGLNNLSKNRIPWTDLLDRIKGKAKFDNGELPNTFIYERAVFENKTVKDIRETEFDIKLSIAELLATIETNEFYEMLFNLKCKNYLTTNYDYAFRNFITQTEKYLSYNNSTEDIYSIRRQTRILDKRENEVCKIWHIHGEIETPVSIMLGFDHYCGSVSKLDAYVKGTYEFQEDSKPVKIKKMTDKLKTKEFDNRSWAELFFNTNIHILGFSLDYSETDLWWILTKRARIIHEEKTKSLVKNKIFFYERYINSDKEELLNSLNVTVVKPKPDNYTNDWHKYYTDTINDIRDKVR
ncbi:SIR2 family protein [Flectobacillus sp. BAB-3569]|uniref:SIR2 family protein n=1 Tax=Flectobacillus sp. BAB-3569 TaxID=1509483 RepID=UPI000BA2EFEE|nr:SIR2 family protein [Flectobacillus sp. BAB-3569]PAC27044.1 hypothetical protein BWI92_24295 [Flectobacillus sp. BAB-3569]